jgi:MarR family transcriptional regulator, organic hydroperoxide resistance regulator
MSNYIGAMENTEGIIALVSTIREKANRFIAEQLKRQGITDIATPYGGIFVHLFKNGELSMGDIARKIDRDKSTVTSLVKKLVALGYVETSTSSSDSRVTTVRLTEKGGALENDFKEISIMLQEMIYQDFSALEKEILVRLLMRVKGNFEDHQSDSLT